MLEEKKEDEVSLSEILEDYGVTVTDDIEDINLKGKKVFKVDKDLYGQCNQFLKLIPKACLNSYNGKVFRAHFDDGLGVLQEAAGPGNYFRGNVVGKNGKFAQSVKWEKLSSAPQVVGGIFTVMSVASGQYFLAEINKDLRKIEREVHQVYQFLENDKKSKLIANEEFLKGIQNSVFSISNNAVQQTATVITIQNIKLNALADIDFYKIQLGNAYARYSKKTKADEVIEINKELGQNIYQYWYALYIYCFSSYLEPVVAKNSDPNYLKTITDDLPSRLKDFNESFDELQEKMQYYISDTKGFETNKVLSVAAKVLNHEPNVIIPPVEAGMILMAAVVNAAEKHDKKVVDARVKDARRIPEISEIKKNLDSIDLFRKKLSMYDSIYNSELDLIEMDGELFIRYS